MRTSVLHFAQAYRQQDTTGQWDLRSQFSLGTELSDLASDRNSDAQFISWSGKIQRSQALGTDNLLTVLLETQLSPNNLLSPYQFKMDDRQFSGFNQSDRPANIFGNSGLRFRMDDRITIAHHQQKPLATIIPFVELGYAWGRANAQTNNQFLGRTGLGVLIEPINGLDIQLDYLTQWGDLSANDSIDSLYVTVGYETQW